MNRFDLAYGGLLLLLSPLLVGIRLLRPAAWAKIRAKWQAPLPPARPKQGTRIWLHAASLGEVRLALRIKDALSQRHPVWDFLLSCNTPSGLELAQKEHEGINLLLPLDWSWKINQLINRFQPDHLILVEAEVWPNLLHAMGRRGKIFLANARLSEQHFPNYRRFRWFFGPLFDQASYLQPGDLASAERLARLGVAADKLHFAGNFKFTLPQQPALELLEQTRQAYQLGDGFVVVGASIQPSEVSILVSAFRQLGAQHAHLVLIPRHPEKRAEFIAQFQAQGFAPGQPSPGQGQIHFIDEFGVLPIWYSLADVVFVGGSFGQRGGQNMIEPCGLGKPVAVGPNTANFAAEVAELVQAQGLVQVQSSVELGEFFSRCRQDPAYAQGLGQKAQACVERNAGALEAFCQRVSEEVT